MPPWIWPSATGDSGSSPRRRRWATNARGSPCPSSLVDLDDRDVDHRTAVSSCRGPSPRCARAVATGLGDLGPRLGDRGVARHVEAPLLDIEHDVVGVRLEQVRGGARGPCRPSRPPPCAMRLRRLRRAGTERADAERDPPVSPWITSMFSMGIPVCSLTIIAHVVTCPWPCDAVPVYTYPAVPSGLTSSAPNSGNGRPADSTYELTPSPTAVLPGSTPPACSAPQLRRSRRLQCQIQCPLVVAGVIDRPVACSVNGEWHLQGSGVPAPDLDRIHPDLGRERVHRALHRAGDLRPPSTPIGTRPGSCSSPPVRTHGLDLRKPIRARRQTRVETATIDPRPGYAPVSWRIDNRRH